MRRPARRPSAVAAGPATPTGAGRRRRGTAASARRAAARRGRRPGAAELLSAWRMPRSVGRKASGSREAAHGHVPRRSTGRCPGSASSARRAAARSAPALEVDARRRPARRLSRVSVARRARAWRASPGPRRRARPGGEEVREAADRAATGSPCWRDQPARAASRAPASDTCWPSTARMASSSPSTCPGRAGRAPRDQRARCSRVGAERARSTATGSASRSSSAPAAVRPPTPRSRRSVEPAARAATWSGIGRSSTTPSPRGRRRLRR